MPGYYEEVECDECNGLGHVDGANCGACRSTGYQEVWVEVETTEVDDMADAYGLDNVGHLII